MIVEQIWTANSGRNFNYLIACSETGEALAVDPLDHEKCLAAARAKGWTITQILNTHEHRDHTGGNDPVVAATTAALPPVWSWCSWVLRIWVMRQPRTFAADKHFSESSGSIASASPVSGQAIR